MNCFKNYFDNRIILCFLQWRWVKFEFLRRKHFPFFCPTKYHYWSKVNFQLKVEKQTLTLRDICISKKMENFILDFEVLHCNKTFAALERPLIWIKSTKTKPFFPLHPPDEMGLPCTNLDITGTTPLLRRARDKDEKITVFKGGESLAVEETKTWLTVAAPPSPLLPCPYYPVLMLRGDKWTSGASKSRNELSLTPQSVLLPLSWHSGGCFMSLWCVSGNADPGRLSHLSGGHTLCRAAPRGAKA